METTGTIEVFKVPPAVVDMLLESIVLMYWMMTVLLPQLMLFLLQAVIFVPFVMLFGYILMNCICYVIDICDHLHQKVCEFCEYVYSIFHHLYQKVCEFCADAVLSIWADVA